MYRRVGLIDQDMHATANKAQLNCILVAAAPTATATAAPAAICQRFALRVGEHSAPQAVYVLIVQSM